MVFKSILTALCTVVMISLPSGVRADEWAENRASGLLGQLAQAEDEAIAARLETQIVAQWSRSGSPAMDLLLKRGRDALAVSDTAAAIEHFRALTDHAPDFAEGWQGLALAYFQADKYGVALDALERTLALNPNHFGALRGLGAIHEQIGNAGLAYAAFARVLDLRPHDQDVINAMARLEHDVKGVTL